MTMPLITCPTCASKLIFPRCWEPFGDDHALVDRRCPECEHEDRVVATTFAARLWERAQERRRVELAADLLQLELETWLEAGSQPADAA
jgi:DNA-directed RNA polymerase subunit RPC12/RpoP